MNRSQIIKVAIAALVIFVVFRMMCSKNKYERYSDNWDEAGPDSWGTIPPGTVTNRPVVTMGPSTTQIPVTPMPLATSVDLLPKTSPSPQPGQTAWAEFAPQSLQGQQFLDPTKYAGVDTQGASLKNASWDIRRDPPIPRADVGPFLNSTIESDPYRKPLDDCR